MPRMSRLVRLQPFAAFCVGAGDYDPVTPPSYAEKVEGSLEVYPVNNYGAVEVGVHRFYKKTEGQPDKLVEIAKFTQVWKKDPSGWKLARVLSYDHKLAE